MKTILGISTAVLATIMLVGSVFAITYNPGSTAQATAGVLQCNDNSQCSGDTPICDVNSGNCVAATCGVSATGIGFGNLEPGATAGSGYTIYSQVTNGGTVPATELWVMGTDWIGQTIDNAHTMPVGSTSWIISGGSGWTPLSGSNALTGATVSPGSPTNVYFSLTVPTNTPNDNYAQTITFTSGC